MGTDYVTGFPLQQEGQILGETVEITATTLPELWSLVSGLTPSITMGQFLAAMQSNLLLAQPDFNDDGGGGGPIEF
jgi:hypothetical protein